MIDAPKTLEEAQAHIYGSWAGNPNGHKYHFGKCAYSYYQQRSYISRQCGCNNGHGPNGLYCKRHAKMVK